MTRRLALTLASALLLAAALLSPLAPATVLQSGNLRLTLLSLVQPHRLPRTEQAPIAVFLSGHVAAVDKGVPPQLRGFTVYVNRHGSLRSKGLPVCDITQIQPSTTERAVSICGPAVIGSGQFWAHIVLPGQDPYPTHGRLLVFNGRRGCSAAAARPTFPATGWGRPSSPRTQEAKRALHVSDRGRRDAPCHPQPVILAHIYTENPFATSFVIPFAIRHIHRGAYGLKLTADLPRALGEWGYVDRIKLTLRRKYRVGGQARSYFNANCPAVAGSRLASFELAKADFTFGHRNVTLSVPKSCAVKGP